MNQSVNLFHPVHPVHPCLIPSSFALATYRFFNASIGRHTPLPRLPSVPVFAKRRMASLVMIRTFLAAAFTPGGDYE
jgi:hypothetical protein